MVFWEMGQSDSKMHLDKCIGEKSQEKKMKESNKVGIIICLISMSAVGGNKFKRVSLLQKD